MGPRKGMAYLVRGQTGSNSQEVYSGEPTAATGMVGAPGEESFQYVKSQGFKEEKTAGRD